MITNEQKLKICKMLDEHCKSIGGVNKASRSMNVSSSVISQVMNEKWSLISDSMWIKIAKQLGFFNGDWKVIETVNYRIVHQLLMDAKTQSRVHALIGGAGWGKDAAAKDFAVGVENVFIVNCAEYFNKKHFMMEVLKSMNERCSGTVPEMVDRAVRLINSMHTPLFVFNEFDKLKDEAFYFIITFYNLCEDKCGIVAMATDQLEKRITRGLFLNKKGYQEIFSRFGRRFIELKTPSKADVSAICMANGVSDPETIATIYNSCEGDLRRAKKLIQNYAKKEQDQADTAA